MNLRQTSFAAGELDPLMWGRTDSPLFRLGLRSLRDFFVTRQGQAMTRPGTQYVGNLADPTTSAILVPFIVSDEDGYLIEISFSQTVRAWKNGAVVWTGTAPFIVLGQPGPLQYAQSGDLLTIANRGQVYELRRTSSTTFVFSTMSFSKAAPQWVQLPTTVKTTLPYLIDSGNLTVATATSPVRKWRWWVSTVLRDSNGRTFESAAYEVVQKKTTTFLTYDGSAAVGPDRPVTLQRATSGTLWAGTNTYEVKGYNWYRGVGDYSGFIGHTTTELDFIDDGTEPQYELPHPREVNPFVLPSGVIDYPKTVGYFENKLVFAGTYNRPASVLLSETDNYTGWQVPPIPVPSQALEFELAVRKRESVRGMASLQRMLLVTDAGVWSVGGEAPLTPTTLAPRLISEVGGAWMRPLVLGDSLLYLRNKGVGLRLVQQSENAGGLYSSGDISWHARHFFERIDTSGSPVFTSVGIVDMAWQEDPWNQVWLVRADGALLSMQYDGQAAGFALHTTGPTIPASDSDRFEAVAVVPEGNEDVVYFVVKRGANYTLERFSSRSNPTLYAGLNSVDCAVPFEEGPPVALVDLGAAGAVLEGRQVWAIAAGNEPIGPVTVVAGKADFAAAGFAMRTSNNVIADSVFGWVGLLFQPTLTTLDVVTSESRMAQKTVEKVGIEVAESIGLEVGQDTDDPTRLQLVPWLQRSISSGYGVPSAASAVVEVNVKGGWDNGARVTLKQAKPLPLTVLGITRKVAGGG